MRRFIIVVFVFFLFGCSYNFVGESNSLPGGIKKLYIANVVNSTNEPNLQIYLKSDLVDTFDLERRVVVVQSKDLADGILKVEISDYSVNPISYDASGLANRYRCVIEVKVELMDKNGKVIEEKTVDSYRDYNAKDEVSATEKARSEISKDVLQDLALKIRDALFMNF